MAYARLKIVKKLSRPAFGSTGGGVQLSLFLIDMSYNQPLMRDAETAGKHRNQWEPLETIDEARQP